MNPIPGHPQVPLGSTWSSWFLYECLYYVGIPLFGLGFSVRWEGSKNLPRTGPALLIANHQSFLDPWLVGVTMPRHLVYLARKSLFRNRLFAKIIQGLNAVPINQEGIGKEGIQAILEQLKQGHPVLVFPEGERCYDGRLHPLKPGIHLLIKRAQAPIVPVGIAGAFDAFPRQRHWPALAPLFLPAKPGTLAVSVGQPLDSRRFAEMPREQALQGLFEEIDRVQKKAEKLRAQ